FEQDDDTKDNNRYTRAAAFFNDWLNESILIREDRPVYYWYEQKFTWKGTTYSREGLVGTIKAEPYKQKSVIPHEETLSKPKEDRLNLLNHCRANFSPIFGLYPDREKAVDHECSAVKEDEPIISFADMEGQSHKLWILKNPSLHRRLENLFREWSIFVADGHHRYETALHFSEIMASQQKQGYDHALIFLINIYSPGLLILPTHRVISNLKDFNVNAFIQKLEEHFLIEDCGPANKAELPKYTRKMEENGCQNSVIGFCAKGRLYQLTFRSSREQQHDVDVLQKYILENAINLMPEDLRDNDLLSYTHSEEEALSMVCEQDAQIAFFLNPPNMECIINTASRGLRLPQKSTYFYPKLVSGLLINKLGN
ncbi:MAG: DUF1015 domain-containing protein, partial [Dethiobacteria bacterium]